MSRKTCLYLLAVMLLAGCPVPEVPGNDGPCAVYRDHPSAYALCRLQARSDADHPAEICAETGQLAATCTQLWVMPRIGDQVIHGRKAG